MISVLYILEAFGHILIILNITALIQGGSNMTGTNCGLFTHK
jgi:hypothetical protein